MKAITKFIRQRLVEWNKKGYSPLAINSKHCSIFTSELKKQFPKGYMLWGEDNPHLFKTNVSPVGHCFFTLNGMYYDAESPKGTNRPDDLEYYKRST